MPWGRLDDSLYDHPKLDELGAMRLPCVGLWVLAISWSNRHLTDGFIPSDRMKRLGGNAGLTGQLVTSGLLDVVEGGFAIHDFLSFNESRESVKRRREQERERWHRRRASGVDSGMESRKDSGVDSVTPTRGTGMDGKERGSRGEPILVDPQKLTTEERQEAFLTEAKRRGLPT